MMPEASHHGHETETHSCREHPGHDAYCNEGQAANYDQGLAYVLEQCNHDQQHDYYRVREVFEQIFGRLAACIVFSKPSQGVAVR